MSDSILDSIDALRAEIPLLTAGNLHNFRRNGANIVVRIYQRTEGDRSLRRVYMIHLQRVVKKADKKLKHERLHS